MPESQAAELELSVSEFVALVNQSLEYAYPTVVIQGELANFKVSKNRWIYFDLKDETASVRFFGTVYQLPGPLEDGMKLVVKGSPRLHPLYGFSVNVLTLRPAGEGSIKKAAELLKAKLAGEGLFDTERKRSLPYPPSHIGLITSAESAAYTDFVKVLGQRWGGLDITLVDVQVQGEAAPGQLVEALERLNQLAEPPEVVIITRGGGSADDLQAFSNEAVVRAVAASRIPTLVAIGHEVDISLAELAADQRASTPSNAAELLVPDRRAQLVHLEQVRKQLVLAADRHLAQAKADIDRLGRELGEVVRRVASQASDHVKLRRQTLLAFDPQAVLRRGYSLVRSGQKLVRSGRQVQKGSALDIQLSDARLAASVEAVIMEAKDESKT